MAYHEKMPLSFAQIHDVRLKIKLLPERSDEPRSASHRLESIACRQRLTDSRCFMMPEAYQDELPVERRNIVPDGRTAVRRQVIPDAQPFAANPQGQCPL